jgi:hypothetical protein
LFIFQLIASVLGWESKEKDRERGVKEREGSNVSSHRTSPLFDFQFDGILFRVETKRVRGNKRGKKNRSERKREKIE